MFLILLLGLLLLALDLPICDGDTFFHLTVGDYIMKNGFPVKDPFSMHDISYMPHEWLSDVIFSLIYKITGYVGLFIFQYIIIILLIALMYRLNKLVTKDKKYLSLICSTIAVFLISRYFITIRPQIFTYLIFVTELYIIETFLLKQDKKILLWLPVLAVLLANFHIGAYPLFFILILPYMVDSAIPLSIGRIKSRRAKVGADDSFKALLKYTLLSIPVGILNPYGIKKITYFTLIFRSDVTVKVSEWMSPDFDTMLGITVFLTLFVVGTVFISTKQTFSLKAFFMLSGMGYMALSGIRYFPYFLIVAGYITAEYLEKMLSDDEWEKTEIRIKNILNNKSSIFMVGILIGFVILLKVGSGQFKIKDLSYFPDKAVNYLKESTDYKNLRMYNEYYHGGFLMFNGIKVFIDSRGDLYVKEYNPDCMVLNDYRKVINGTEYYNDVFKKYDFDHALVYKGRIVDTMLNRDTNWKCVYSDDRFILYEKVGGNDG